MKFATATTAIVLALSVTAADATPKHGDRTYNTNKNYNTNWNKNYNHNSQNQYQGQAQGQAQAAIAGAIATGGTSSSNATGGAGGAGGNSNQTQSSSAQSSNNGGNVNIEGSIGAASIAPSECAKGLSVGGFAIGGYASVALTDTECKILNEAQWLQSMGRHDLALTHLTNIKRFRTTVRSVQNANVAAAPVISTRSVTYTQAPAPVARAYTFCGYVDGVLTARAASADLAEAAGAQCHQAAIAGLIE